MIEVVFLIEIDLLLTELTVVSSFYMFLRSKGFTPQTDDRFPLDALDLDTSGHIDP